MTATNDNPLMITPLWPLDDNLRWQPLDDKPWMTSPDDTPDNYFRGQPGKTTMHYKIISGKNTTLRRVD